MIVVNGLKYGFLSRFNPLKNDLLQCFKAKACSKI